MEKAFCFGFVFVIFFFFNCCFNAINCSSDGTDNLSIGQIHDQNLKMQRLLEKWDSITRRGCARCFGFDEIPTLIDRHFQSRRIFYNNASYLGRYGGVSTCISLPTVERIAFLRAHKCPAKASNDV